MEREHFWHILKTDFGYQSPQKRCFLAENLFGWATFIYYTRLLKLICINSVIARRGNLDRERWANASFFVIKIVESVGGKFQVSGLEGVINQKGPWVYIANHMSLLDTFLLPCFVLAFSNLTFVIKEGLLRYPVFGEIMRAVNPIAVTRHSPREDLKWVLSKGQEFLSNGYSIVIFPQATRSAVFDAASFNSLGVKLARKAGVPVVPIAFKTDFHGNGKIVKDLGPVDPKKTLYIKFGSPMIVEGGGQATHQKVTEFIARNLSMWGCEVRGVSDF